MKIVEIKKPCSENWHRFIPDEQGAFCNSCQKSVIDFTQKTKDEILNFFNQNIGKKICGRIEQNQLNELNADYADWENPHLEIFQSKFVWALLLVFGMALFSCKGSEEIFDSTHAETAFMERDSNLLNQYESLSAIEYNQDTTNNGQINQPTEKPEPLNESNQFLPPEIMIEPITTYGYPITIMGDIWYFPPGHFAEEETSLTLDYRLPLNELETMFTHSSFEIESFPTTTETGIEQLVISTYSFARLSITIRNEKAEDVLEIHNEEINSGKHLFEIDLTGYKPDLYFICIQHGDNEKILPLQLLNTTL